MDNKTLLLVLMIVLIVFIVLLAVLGIVFIVALRKRRPVIKVVMAPQAMKNAHAEEEDSKPAAPAVNASMPVAAAADDVPPPVAKSEPEQEEPESEPESEEEDDDDEDATTYVTEGTERVRYNRSYTAKLAQLANKSKEWYSTLKNELLSYEKVKSRMSWKHETFRVGRMTVAKFVVRGKTLCMLVPVEPESYEGTKFSVRDVSNIGSMADTPTMYRIRKERRCRYAKEMIADIMKELKVYKDSHFEAQDYFVPYEGDMALMQRGLVKRVVTGSTRTFKIEEVENEAAATNGSAEGAKA